MTVINERPASRKLRIAQQRGFVGNRALEPVIQSAFGIARESAGLLYHIAGLGIALLSGPRPKHGVKQTGSPVPKGPNVILFPRLEASSRRRNSIGINHDHHV
jgi:hypothetical protein